MARGTVISVVCLLACAALAAPAAADNQFKLDPTAVSPGAIAVDSAGSAYVTWNPAQGMPMFCKVPVGATHCSDHQQLAQLTSPSPLAEDPSEARGFQNTEQPTPIVGPDGIVFVIASRYVVGDELIWTSTNGGKTFGSPREIPYDSQPLASNANAESFPNPDLLGTDDLIPLNDGNYDGYVEGSSLGFINAGSDGAVNPTIQYAQSSSEDFDVGFNIDDTNVALAGHQGFSEYAWSEASDAGPTTLGVSSYGSDSPSARSDLVEAFGLASTQRQLAYYDFQSAPGAPSGPYAGQRYWHGPVSLGDGDLPRLAGGPGGLFLLSQDGSNLNQVQIRKWNLSSHTFGAPKTLARITNFGYGGGLGESLASGEVAAVWPSATGSQLELYLSKNGGSQFTPASPIAAIEEFEGQDNARVAVAGDGTGWVTFRDGKGLQIANLFPDDLSFANMHLRLARKGRNEYVKVPVICPADSGACRVVLSLTAGGKTLARHVFKEHAGARTLSLSFSRAGIAALNRHGRKPYRLRLKVQLKLSGAPAHTSAGSVTLRGL